MNSNARRAGLIVCLIFIATVAALRAADGPAGTIKFTARSLGNEAGKEVPHERPVEWDARETAVIICDMWDKHWCASATRRCGEIAPGIDRLAKSVRAKGGLIVHAPSDTMKFYEGTPGRKLAQDAPRAEPPTPLAGWRKIDPTCEGPLPIDDKDGGCDDEPQCKNYRAWSRQTPLIEVMPGDAVSENGQEVFNLFKQRGIKHVIVCGVHLNMCVLGRTFAIRQMTTWGFDCVLVRDLTDTMYNPRKAPFVPHEKGTELMIAHVERNWCPSTISGEIINAK